MPVSIDSSGMTKHLVRNIKLAPFVLTITNISYQDAYLWCLILSYLKEYFLPLDVETHLRYVAGLSHPESGMLS